MNRRGGDAHGSDREKSTGNGGKVRGNGRKMPGTASHDIIILSIYTMPSVVKVLDIHYFVILTTAL